MLLLEWLKKARAQNVPISRQILLEKEKQFTNMFGESFTLTDGWLQDGKKETISF